MLRSPPDVVKLALGALDLRRACDPPQPPEAMLDGMLAVLRDFVAFDIATFAEYASEPTLPEAADQILVRGHYAVDDGRRFDWPARWIRVPAALQSLLAGEVLAVPSVDGFFRANPAFRGLRGNMVIQTYLRRGARSFLVVPLHEAGGQVVSSLTFARKDGAPFEAADQQVLSRLDVAGALRLVRHAYRSRAAAFRQEIRDLFERKADPDEVARTAVVRVCEWYRWDYAAIFRVAHARGRFELVQQHNASDKRMLLEDGYSQGFADGVLGRALKTGQPVRVEDTTRRSRHGYVQSLPDARSCLCYPILLEDGVEWILDCESSEVGAFQHPDEVELGGLIEEAQKSLALWFEMRLNRALIENLDQGVVVVDQANRITRLNGLAGRLLGAPEEEDIAGASGAAGPPTGRVYRSLRGTPLARFAADEAAKGILATGHVAATPLRLRGADGVERHVVASSREAEDAFNRRIWRLSDPRAWDWMTNLEYMRATVQGVAQQTRGPLLLASALVAKAGGLVDGDPVLLGLLSRARSSLAKTDITYERLVAGLEFERAPVGTPVAVDITSILEGFLGDLPEEDRRAVELTCDEAVPAAWGDPDRLRFVLRSTIGYLLATRDPRGPVAVHAGATARQIVLDLSAGVPGGSGSGLPSAAGAADPLARAQADAQEATAHALSTVRRVVESNGGSLRIGRPAGRLTLRLTWPAAISRPRATVAGHA